VSYLTQDGRRDQSEDLGLYSRLASMGHMAPLEHAARPMSPEELEEFRMHNLWVRIDGELRVIYTRNAKAMLHALHLANIEVVEEDITNFCGNLNGWVQHRKELAGEAVFGSAPVT
jgi:hypothetical protein